MHGKDADVSALHVKTDQRVKTALTAKLMTVNKPTAKFVYKISRCYR